MASRRLRSRRSHPLRSCAAAAPSSSPDCSLLAASVTAGILALTGGGTPTNAGDPALDLATNQVAAVDVKSGKLLVAAPLPGRPTDVAVGNETSWVATVDSTAVTGVSGRTRSISRTIPLRGSADAIAVGEGSVWVADGTHGVLSRIDTGYQQVAERIRFPRAASRARVPGRLKAPRASLAVGGGAVWLTNGSDRLMRVDPETGRVTSKSTGRRVDGVAAGAGAVWVISSRSATVLRVDPRRGTVTDAVPIVARPRTDAPSPIAIAAARRAVWVLNGNTATVTQIDPRTLGVATTIPIGVERVPTDIAATGAGAWVANGDGSLSRIDPRASEPRMIEVGESLERVAADRATVWVTTTALDQKLPGGVE